MSRRDIRKAGKFVEHADVEYVAGRNLVTEAFKAERPLKKVLIENSIREGLRNLDENSLKTGQNYSNDTRINDIITYAKNKSISLEFVSKDIIQKIEHKIGIKSEGVIGIADKRDDMDVEDVLALCKRKNKEPFIIIVNNILYEENLGAILRTAAAAGVDAVVIPKRDKRTLTPNVARISMGGSEYVHFIKDNLFDALDKIHEEGIKIVGVELNGDSYYYDEDLKGPIAIVLGGEDAGISEPLQKRCDSIVKIPMIGKIQSLNVSVSTAIIIYEKVRQECQS